MEFSEAEKTVLAGIAQRHPSNIQAAIAMAYEAGILEGAMRVSRSLALKGLEQAQASNTGSNDDGDDDGPLSAADAAWLRAQGIDPAKKFRLRNSVFTITGVRRTRWKFPVSAKTQNGTGYKFSIAQIKGYQAQ